MNTDTQNPTIDKHHPDYRMGTEAELAPDTTVSALLETALETGNTAFVDRALRRLAAADEGWETR